MAKTLQLAAVARHIGVSRRTLYNQLKSGRFPVQPLEGTNPRRWSVEELDAWLRGNKG